MKTQPPSSTERQLDPLLCVHCPDLCLYSCPTIVGGGTTTTSPYGKVTALHWAENTTILNMKEVSHLPFLCSECDLCTTVCAHDQPVSQFLYKVRERLHQLHETPEEAKCMLPDEENLRQVLVQAKKSLNLKEQPKVIFAPGCSMLSQGPDRVVSTVKLLMRLGISSVGVDPDAPLCCGAPWRDLGDTGGFLGRVSHWRRLHSMREGVVVGDPRCLRTIIEHTPSPLNEQYQPQIFGLHRFLSRAIRGALRKRLELRIAIHETCHIARHLDKNPDALQILKSILKEQPKNLGFHSQESQCCGHSGGLSTMAPELALGAAQRLLEHASLLNIDCLLTFSPGCAGHLDTARKQDPSLPRVVEMVDLVEMALDLNQGENK